MGGKDIFICDSTNAGKGILQAYKKNPRWLAYNGTEPVWLKSYYESGHGAIAQSFDWVTKNVYQPMIDRGYNHLQVNWLLSLCCFDQYYTDGPAQSTKDLALYQSGKASSTMRLDVWKLMEQNVEWLNERNVGLFMFLGFDGGRNGGPAWTSLNTSEQDFYVRYVIARLAPYANIAGWNYVWEVDGNRENEELGWARLVQKYDVFNHLRAYHDEKPKYNEFNRPEYNFAGIENHRINSDNREPKYWAAPWTHHVACQMGYVPGKPVYMVEGNALWRRYWAAKILKETGKTPTFDELRQSAWACATAASSFTWCGHQGEGNLKAFGSDGLPFYGDVNLYASSALELDILSNVMNNDVLFHRMIPSDSLLSEHNNKSVWCLSETGEQYLVFASNGDPFKLQLASGQYNSNQWLNAKTGSGLKIASFSATENEQISFTPPNTNTDWVLLIRKEWNQNISDEVSIISAKTDTTGYKIIASCNSELKIPEDYTFGFTVKDGTKALSIGRISLDNNDWQNVIIELNKPVTPKKDIRLSYSGTLISTDGLVLAPFKDLEVTNNTVEESIVNGIKGYGKINFSIFPNPFNEEFEIECDNKIQLVQILDLSGKIVFEIKNVGKSQTTISPLNFQKGIYFIHVTCNDNTNIMKLIKR